MKKNSVMVVTLTCLLLMMSEVQAAGQVGQMWINASGAGHDAFMKVMRKNGWTRGKGDEEQISNDVLSELMYTKSSKEGWLRLVDKELRTLDSYKTLVREEVPGMKGEWINIKKSEKHNRRKDEKKTCKGIFPVKKINFLFYCNHPDSLIIS